MESLAGKHVWIIGASSGIGRALAKELARRGARLLLSSRSDDELKRLRDEIGEQHFVFPVDVRDLGDVINACEEAQENLNRIDSVVHLAALYEPTRLTSMDIESVRRLVDVNLMGAFNVIHAVLPVFKRQGYGQLLLCGSVAGYRGLPNGQPYSATKAAIINLTESLKVENPALDIKLINPGFVRTPLTDKNDFKMPMIEPEQAARAIADGMLKKNFEIHFPKRFTLLMKFLRSLPYFVYFKIAQNMAREQAS